MKKKLAALLTAFTLLLSITAYADIPKFHYSFEEAFKMALDNTPEYKVMDNTIDDAYDNYEYLDKKTPSTVKFKKSKKMKYFILEDVDGQTALDTAWNTYRLLKLSKDNIKRNIELSLKKIVIGIEKAEMAVKEAKINEKALNEQLRLLEIQYEQSLISKNNYKNKKRELKDIIKSLDDVDKAVDMSYHQLNMLLGRKDNNDIVIKMDSKNIPLEQLDLEQIKKDMINISDKATNYSPSILRLPGSLIVLKNDRSIIKSRYSLIAEQYDEYNLDKLDDDDRDETEDLLKKAHIDYEVADKKYNNALAQFDKDFDDMIEDMEDLYDNIKDIKEEIADEKSNQKIYKIKYDSGMISKIEYDNLNDNMVLLENKLRSAELDLNMKYAELLIYSDLKKVVLAE